MTPPGWDLTQARLHLIALSTTLAAFVQRDPEQEVRGIAIPVLDAAISATRGLLEGNPIIAQIGDVISLDTIEEGAIRAADALIVVEQLLAAIPEPGLNPWVG